MPKKKKTRKQKILADIRHTVPFQITSPDAVIAPVQSEHYVSQSTPSPVVSAAIDTSRYRYLYKDLAKTTLLSISIIVAELVLRYVLFGAS